MRLAPRGWHSLGLEYHVLSLGLTLCVALGVALSCRPARSMRSAAPHGFPAPVTSPRVVGVAVPGAGWVPTPEKKRPVEVLFKSPELRAQGTVAILVTFNQPMVRLGRARKRAQDPSRYPIRVDPPVRAVYRWVAGDTLKVALTAPLKNAHRYRVEVPAGTKAVNGARLARAVRWSFETPRPKLRGVDVVHRRTVLHDRVHPTDRYRLRFSQRVTLAELRQRVQLRLDGRSVGFGLSRGPKMKPQEALLTPRRRPRQGETVTVGVDKGLRSTEGPLPSTAVASRKFHVYGPLRVTGIDCDEEKAGPKGRCWPMVTDGHGGLRLRFSEHVTRAQLLRHLRVTPRPRGLKKALVPLQDQCWVRGQPQVKCARQWQVNQDLLPRRRYRVQVTPGLRDVHGQRLARGHRARFATRDFPPGLFLPDSGQGIREPWHPYRFKAVNAPQVDAALFTFRGADLVRFLGCQRRSHTWMTACLPKRLRSDQRVKLKAQRNRVQTTTLKLPHGLNVLRVSSPQVVNEKSQRVLFYRTVIQTGLGLQTRLTAYGLTVWVTSLRRALPSAQTAVTVYGLSGKVLWTGKTDARGLAEVPRTALGGATRQRPAEMVVQAHTGRDLSYLVLRPKIGCRTSSWRYAYHPDYIGESGAVQELARCDDLRGDRPLLAGYVSTERGIYRPGQTVHAHGAVRRYVSWQGAPAHGLKAQVQLVSPTAVVLAQKDVRLDAHGVFLAKLPLPRGGRLGYHRVWLRVGKKTIASYGLRVAEYRAPRFVARVWAPALNVPADRPLDVTVSGRYLFGGSMAGAAYRLTAKRSVTLIRIPKHTQYYVGVDGSLLGRSTETLHRSAGVLDGAGRRTTRIALTAAGNKPLPWPASVRLEAEVRSAAHRTAASSYWLTQHPGALYVGVKRLVPRGNVLRFHVVALTQRGQRKRARVTLRFHGIKDNKSSWYHLLDPRRVLQRRTVEVPEQGATVAWRFPRGYKHEHAVIWLSVTDGRGREARTAWLVQKPNRWSRQDDRNKRLVKQRTQTLSIRLDKDLSKGETYRPGETAVVTVKRRGRQGDAVLFVERERIFKTVPLRFDARGRAVVRLKVRKRYHRQVTVRAVLVRRGKALRDKLGPVLSARAALRVTDAPYTLRVHLQTDKKTYRPGGRVTVDLRVTDGLMRARPGRVVLMAVDEAVLNLTSFYLPTPYHALTHTPADGVLAKDVRQRLDPLGINVFHRDHSVSSDAEDALGALMGHTVGSAQGMGGLGLMAAGSRGRKQKPRKRFLTTAWHTTVVTDAQGRARASFTLPDNLTAYRIMAFAVDKHRSSGTGWTRFEVDLPLLTLPALPRLLRAGDRAEAGVVIYHKQGSGPARVTARVQGPVKLVGPTARRVQLVKGKGVNVRFGLRATGPGTARFTFTVRAGGLTDRVEASLPVKRPTLREASSVSGQTAGAVRHAIERLAGLRADVGGLELSLASTALTGVEDGMEQLIDYPYGCLEQKSSRLLALIGAVALGDRFALKLGGSPRALIRAGLHQVLAMQQPDGGFGYWPNATQSWAWATAYALIVMHRAHLARSATGVGLPRPAVKQAVAYLRRWVVQHHASRTRHYLYAYHAFVLYALALHGEDVTGPALHLAKHSAHRPLFARALLLAALTTGRKRSSAVRKRVAALVSGLGNSLRVEGTHAHAEEGLDVGYQVMMHSDDRTTAMVLLALLSARPQHAMVGRLVRWFLQGRKQARFRNTQEAAWAVMALWDYARIREQVKPDFEAGVWVGNRRVLKAVFKGRSVKPQHKNISMRQLQRMAGAAARSLLVAKRGKGTLYYVARLRYARRALPRSPRDRGFAVSKSIVVLDAAGLPLKVQRPPRLGDTVLITLRVKSTETRRYVVVDDPLPAGFEAIDTQLATASRNRGAALRRFRVSLYDHRELRDDRVLFFRDLAPAGTLTYRYLARVSTPGQFLMPPTKAEEMYNPETFGHSGARSLRFPK